METFIVLTLKAGEAYPLARPEYVRLPYQDLA